MRLLLILIVVAPACDTTLHFANQPDANTSTDASPACAEARGHSDFAFVRDKIFAKSCKFEASCHGSTGRAAKLSLTPANAYRELIHVESIKKPDWVLVSPGMPEKSYLLVKLGAVEGPLVGDRMPYRNRLLCPEKLDAVTNWIAQGAREDPLVVPDAAANPDAMSAPIPDGPIPDVPMAALSDGGL